MIYFIVFAALFVTSCGHSSAFDKRYEAAIKYIQADDTINAKVSKLLPSDYVKSSTPSFIVDDTIQVLFLPLETVISLKYGEDDTKTAVYDSLRKRERPTWLQYKKLSEQQFIVPELRELSLPENANAVVFFSRFYDNILIAHVAPMNIEFMMPIHKEGDSSLSNNKGVEALPFIGRQYNRMTRFNQFVEVIFTFEEDGTIRKVHARTWKVD